MLNRARQRLPHARYCVQRVTRALQPGEALYESVLVSVSRDGWEIAEPGRYLVQVALRLPSGEDVVSNVLTLRVSPPASRAEEVLAGDFFDIDVARTLASGGTRVMTDAIDTLEEMAGQFGEHPVARHAQLAMGRPFARPFKLIDTGAAQAQPTSVVATGGQISVLPADLTQAGEHMGHAWSSATAPPWPSATCLSASGPAWSPASSAERSREDHHHADDPGPRRAGIILRVVPRTVPRGRRTSR